MADEFDDRNPFEDVQGKEDATGALAAHDHAELEALKAELALAAQQNAEIRANLEADTPGQDLPDSQDVPH